MLHRWQFIVDVLGIRSGIRNALNPNQQQQCMNDDIHTWLQGAHNTKKCGHQTWRKLVEAIQSPVGGNNPRYAKEIADAHPIAS